GRDWLRGRTELHGPDDSDLDPCGHEPVVERAALPIRIRALAIDDEPDPNSSGSLREERLREGLPDRARTEPELVDVDGGLGAAYVVQHRRVEVAALDVHPGCGRRALVEPEREIGASHLSRQEIRCSHAWVVHGRSLYAPADLSQSKLSAIRMASSR